MSPEAWIALGVACATAIVWMVRLEGRINAADKAVQHLAADLARAELELKTAGAKAEMALHIEIAAIKARQDAESANHSETTLALVRLQEQVKHLTNLFERQFIATPSPRAPRSPK